MKQVLLLIILILEAQGPAFASQRPSFDPKIGQSLNLHLQLNDETGASQSLGEIAGGKPALIIFGYDKCPNLCGLVQREVASDLTRSGLSPEDYRALFISIDGTETAADAAKAKDLIRDVTTPLGSRSWRFLTSTHGEGAVLAHEAGINFEEQPRVQQFIHPIAVLALTPEGRIARVLPALNFEPRDLRLALVEASNEKLGSIVDHVTLFCAGFDSSKGQYTATIWVVLRLAGIAMLLALMTGIGLLMRKRP